MALGVTTAVLLVRVAEQTCALPLADVVEVMRALPPREVKGTRPYVRGLAMVRGSPTPVIDVAAFLSGASGVGGYFVTLRAGDKRLALSVDRVIGRADVDVRAFTPLPTVSAHMPASVGSAAADIVTLLRPDAALYADLFLGGQA